MLLKEFDEWVTFWFDWIRPWRDIDVNPYRLVQINWTRVPPHVWLSKFFSLACATFELFNKIDEGTEQKWSFGSGVTFFIMEGKTYWGTDRKGK